MNILLLSQFFQPEPMFKGLPFAQALVARGHSVQVVTGFPNYPGGKLYPGYRIRPFRREVLGGVPVLRLPLFPSHNSSGIGRVANYLSYAASAFLGAPLLSRKPDVIYVYNLVTLMPAARLLRRRYGCPIVLDVQDLWPESIMSSGMMKNRVLMRALGRFCLAGYRAADRVTVLSPGFKRHLVARGVPVEKVEVVYNWCDERPSEVSDDPLSGVQMTRREKNQFNILFAGTMGKVQALDTVLSAAKLLEERLPSVLFTFLGGGVEVERLKSSSASAKNIQFLPRCDSSKALAAIKQADAVLVHLKRDPLFSITIPSKTQTYLFMGRPVLMGVDGDAAELVRAAKAGICFTPEDAQSLAAAVDLLHSMPKVDREMFGKNGRKFYRDELAFETGVRKFDEIFTSTTEAVRSS